MAKDITTKCRCMCRKCGRGYHCNRVGTNCRESKRLMGYRNCAKCHTFCLVNGGGLCPPCVKAVSNG